MEQVKKDRILVVDDEAGIRELLVATLQDKYIVDSASGVKEAIALVAPGKYALIVSDMMMPGLTGLDLIKLAKEKVPQTLVVIVTGYGSVEDAVSAVKHGAEDYVLKPLDLDKFEFTVENLVEKYHLNKQLRTCQKSFELEKVSRMVLETEDIDKTLPDILAMILKMFNVDSGSILLLDKSSEELLVSAVINVDEEKLELIKKYSSEKLAKRSLETLKGVSLDLPSLAGVGPALVFPLSIKTRLLGILNINMHDAGASLNDEDRDVLSIFTVSLALSIENARFIKELVENNERLKGIDKLKTELISNVSHELRTPLTAMKGSLDLLLIYEDNVSEDSKKLLTIMKNNLERQMKLVSDLLDYSRLEAHKLNLELRPSDVGKLLSETVEELKVLAEKSGLELKVVLPSKPLTVNLDPDRIKQVLINLVSNAIKYTEKGFVELSLSEKTDAVVFSVKDSGCGIPEAEQKKMFERFFRVDNYVSRRTPGFGLGLSLSKGIVEAHGGKIWFESSPGKGSTFLFMIPR